jgi:hypothetical protein
MVRLTAALVQECPQVTTPMGERALVIRGRNIQHLEAYAAGSTGGGAATGEDGEGAGVGATSTRDLLFDIACNFDVLDLSENALTRIDGMSFPPRPAPSQISEWSVVSRLTTLILHNNSINRISDACVQSLKHTLHTFVAHNNNFRELSELDVFGKLPLLERLALRGNPVTAKPQYRVHVIGRCAALKLLDYNRVRDVEKADAKALRELEAKEEGTKPRRQRRVAGAAASAFDAADGAAMAALDDVSAAGATNGNGAAAKRLRDDSIAGLSMPAVVSRLQSHQRLPVRRRLARRSATASLTRWQRSWRPRRRPRRWTRWRPSTTVLRTWRCDGGLARCEREDAV